MPPAGPDGERVDRRPLLSGRRRLSRELIIGAALEVVTTSGVGGLTMRSLAAQLQADPSAVYRHFRGKDELLGALADDVLVRVALSESPGSTGAPGEWRVWMIEIAQRLRDLLRTQPALAQLLSSAPVTEAAVRQTAGVLERATAEGWDADAAARTFHAVASFAVGSALLEAGAAVFAPSVIAPPGEPLTADEAAVVRMWSPGAEELDARFIAGLEALLPAG